MPKKPLTAAEKHLIGCYIYHNHPKRRKECVNIAVEHHMIGNQTVKGLALKADDERTMIICLAHHTGKYGIHQIGVETWEAIYGKQVDMIEWTDNRKDEL